ncbi:hypothetical protein ABZS63_34385, partial [Streptomyces sp. NPDC005568]
MTRGVRLVQKVSSTRTFSRVAPHVIPALDRAVHRLTRGRVLPSARMLPGVVLTGERVPAGGRCRETVTAALRWPGRRGRGGFCPS